MSLFRAAALVAVLLPLNSSAQVSGEQIRAYPFPQNLTASATGSRIVHRNNLRVNAAIAEYFERKLGGTGSRNRDD